MIFQWPGAATRWLSMSTSLPFSLRAAALLLLATSQANAVQADAVYTRESTVTAGPVPPNAPAAGAAPAALPPRVVTRTLPPQPKPQKADGERLLALLHNRDVCKIPLDLKVDGATLEEIAARVQTLIPEPAPKIEVRGALAIRLSFALQKSTVGAALGAAATLAGAQLWVFPDHLLLAPRTALSDEEQAAQKQIGDVPWGFGNGSPRRAFSDNEVRRVFSNLIGDELRDKFEGVAATTVPVAGQTSAPLAKTTFSSLSPQAKEMVQQLVAQMNGVHVHEAQLSNPHHRFAVPSFTLSPDSLVQLNTENTRNRESPETWLKVVTPTGDIGWALSGNGMSFSIGGAPTQAKPTPPPFLDPSAGQS